MEQDTGSAGNNLLEALTAAWETARGMKFGAAGLSFLEALEVGERDIEAWGDSAVTSSKLVEGFSDIALRDPRFPSEIRVLAGDGGGIGFYPHLMPNLLLHRALLSDSPTEAICWLEKVLSMPSATGKTIHVLWGAPVNQPLSLTDNVSIVPFESLPESRSKQWLTESVMRGGSTVYTAFDMAAPQSALVIDRSIDPLTYNPEQAKGPDSKEFLKHYELLNEVALALTALGPRVVLSISQWFTFDDPAVEFVTGGMRRGRILEILPLSATDYSVLDPIQAPAIVQGYLRLKGSDRDRVRVALQRLSQAQRRHSVGDKAVEVATALETILGDGNTEMTNKVTVRLARMLGGSFETRQRNAALVKKTYSIRSKLVHSGKVDDKPENVGGKPLDVSAIVKETLGLCSLLIQTIVVQGSIPKWHEFDIRG